MFFLKTIASTAETKPSSAILYPGTAEWSEQQRRSCVSLGNHSSNSKSSSNLTGSSHSSRHGDRPRESPQVPQQPMSFTQQLEQCSRGAKTRPLSKLLSPLQSEPQSPIYASPPMSPTHDPPNLFGEFRRTESSKSSKKQKSKHRFIYFLVASYF